MSPSGETVPATPDGRWGVRQHLNGTPTGGGTVGCGWADEASAIAANPPVEGHGGVHTYEPFERW